MNRYKYVKGLWFTAVWKCALCKKPLSKNAYQFIGDIGCEKDKLGHIPSYCVKCGYEKIIKELPVEMGIWPYDVYPILWGPSELLMMLV